MKRTRFTDEQIISIMAEHEAGAKCADLCRKRGISTMAQRARYRERARNLLPKAIEIRGQSSVTIYANINPIWN